jgi:DNA adenine methylase
MLATTKKFRSPLKTHGGKHYLAPELIPLFPSTKVIVDVFGGGANIIGNVDPVYDRVYNELNPLTYKFWHDLKFGTLKTDYEYCEAVFLAHRDTSALVRTRMSRGGLGKAFAKSERLRGGEPGDLHAWRTAITSIPTIRTLFQSITLLNEDAFTLIPKINDPDTLLYLDPPYLPSSRVSPQAYDYELTTEQHDNLLSLAIASKCRIAISGYHSNLYDSRLPAAGFFLFEFPVPNRAGKGTRLECLWVK